MWPKYEQVLKTCCKFDRFRLGLLGFGLAALTAATLAEPPKDLDAFFRSVTDGRPERVRVLLKEHPDWKDAELFQGIRPLYRASVLGRVEVVEVLLAAGASPSITTDRGSLPLHAASERGHLKIVKMLLKDSSTLSAVNEDGQTALHLAARFKQLAVAQELIRAKAPLGATDARGRSPLHYAAGLGQVEMVKALVEGGADMNALDGEGYSPLGLARTWKRNSYGDVGGYMEGKGAVDTRPSIEDGA